MKSEADEITDPTEIANKLNSHFVQKRVALAKKLPNPTQSIFKTMPLRSSDEVCHCSFESHEVFDCINNINVNKASGSDNTPPKIIKWLGSVISSDVTKIFNKYINAGTYPSFFQNCKSECTLQGR